MQEKVSVIVPVYNSKRYLPACIKSLISQTYPEIEIILIDDGSVDGSSELCDGYAEKYEQVTVIHQVNAGPGAARNAGIEAASGKYLTYVDSDDYVAPDYAEVMVKLLQDYKADIAEVGLVRLLEARNIIEDSDGEVECFEGHEVMMKDYFSPNPRIRNCVGGRMYDMGRFRDIRFSEKSIAEDSEYSLKMLARCDRLVKYHKCFYVYRAYQESLTRGTVSHRKFDVVEIALRDAMLAEREQLEPGSWNYIFQNFMNTCYGLLAMLAVSKKEREFPEELKQMEQVYEKMEKLAQAHNETLSGQLPEDIRNIGAWAEKYRRAHRKEIAVKKVRNAISGTIGKIRTALLYEYKFER